MNENTDHTGLWRLPQKILLGMNRAPLQGFEQMSGMN
jgi:hypothetical protein